MINSLRTLFLSPYNRKKPISALKRFFIWKIIKLFRISHFKYIFWGDRTLYLNHDSFHSMWLMYNNWVDWEEFNLIRRVLKDGDVAIDVGANMGYYSLWMSKFVAKSGLVIAFEPDEVNYAKLNENISLNNLANRIQTEKKAVNNVSGLISFTTSLDGENHITSDDVLNNVIIDSIKLDDYFKAKDIQGVTYLKIDVEGFEMNVLQGCTESLLEKRINIIQLEINNTIVNSGTDKIDLLNLLKHYNYILCNYDVKANRLIPIQYNPDRENYFAISDLININKKLARE